MPVYTARRRRCGWATGESIHAGRYTFHGEFSHEGSNFHRTLHSATAAFNTNRWCFWGNGQVTYRFGLPGYAFRSGSVRFSRQLSRARRMPGGDQPRREDVASALHAAERRRRPRPTCPPICCPPKRSTCVCGLRPATARFRSTTWSFPPLWPARRPRETARRCSPRLPAAIRDLVVEELLLDDSEGHARPRIGLIGQESRIRPLLPVTFCGAATRGCHAGRRRGIRRRRARLAAD